MRKQWETVTIQDVAQVVNGGTPKTKVEKFWGGCHLWITPAEMGNLRSPYITESRRTLTNSGLKNSSASLIPPKSVVLSTRAPIGHLVVNKKTMAFNQGCRAIVPGEKLNYKYLYYFLSGNVKKLDELGSGTTFKELAAGKLKKFELPLPPLPEQKRIVAILDEAFAGIDTAIANTEKNLDNTRELFESYVNAVFSQRNEGWNEQPLRKFSTCVSTGPFGSLLHKSDYVSDGVPVVNPINIVGEKIVPDNRKMVGSDTKARLGAYILNEGDIVIARRGEIGRCAIVTEKQKGWVCGTGCFFIRPSGAINPKVLAHLLRSYSYRLQMERLSSGATMLNLSNSTLSNLKISLPELDEQNKIADQIMELKEQCQKVQFIYQQKLTALTEFKQSLLQKAFSGELSAENTVAAEAVAPEAAQNSVSPQFAAHVIAAAFHWHESQRKDKTFGHVKAQKALHMMESLADLDMGRQPYKDAAGPNDFDHMLAAEQWARDSDFFEFVQRKDGQRGYDFVKGKRFGEWLGQSLQAIEPYQQALDKVVKLLLPLNTEEAELVATVYAAWNNLLLDGVEATEEAIVHEARDNWHPDKRKYSKDRFRIAIAQIRDNGVVPRGRGKRVSGQESLVL